MQEQTYNEGYIYLLIIQNTQRDIEFLGANCHIVFVILILLILCLLLAGAFTNSITNIGAPPAPIYKEHDFIYLWELFVVNLFPQTNILEILKQIRSNHDECYKPLPLEQVLKSHNLLSHEQSSFLAKKYNLLPSMITHVMKIHEDKFKEKSKLYAIIETANIAKGDKKENNIIIMFMTINRLIIQNYTRYVPTRWQDNSNNDEDKYLLNQYLKTNIQYTQYMRYLITNAQLGLYETTTTQQDLLLVVDLVTSIYIFLLHSLL